MHQDLVVTPLQNRICTCENERIDDLIQKGKVRKRGDSIDQSNRKGKK